jgi:hypothetical protein
MVVSQLSATIGGSPGGVGVTGSWVQEAISSINDASVIKDAIVVIRIKMELVHCKDACFNVFSN